MPVASIIFDFDGVLADSFETLFSLNSDALRLIGRSLTRKDYRALFSGNIHHGLRRLIDDDDARTKFNRFKKSNFSKYYSSAKLFPFAKNLAESLCKTRSLGIVSSTRKPFIERLLKKNKTRKFFKIVLGSTAHSKEKELAQAAAFMKVPGKRTIFVTDTAGDIKAGKKMGFRTFAVAWGFHGKAALRKARPENIFVDAAGLYRHLSGPRRRQGTRPG